MECREGFTRGAPTSLFESQLCVHLKRKGALGCEETVIHEFEELQYRLIGLSTLDWKRSLRTLFGRNLLMIEIAIQRTWVSD
jgi:hypothetical protein